MIKIREATFEDWKILLDWRNSIEVRQTCFSQNLVPELEHKNWLHKTLESKTSKLFIALNNEFPIGQVRFDTYGEIAEVSISLDGPSIGKGMGKEVLAEAENELKSFSKIKKIRAKVLANNLKSSKFFQSCGYELYSTEFIKEI